MYFYMSSAIIVIIKVKVDISRNISLMCELTTIFHLTRNVYRLSCGRECNFSP